MALGTPTAWADHRNDGASLTGELSQPVLRAVCEVLRNHTATPEECWFAVWEGWGWLTDGSTGHAACRFEGPHMASMPW